jgi:TIR domain
LARAAIAEATVSGSNRGRGIEAVKAGLSAYLAEHDPQPGTVLAEKAKRNIKCCDAFAVLLTRNTADSSYVHQEVCYALAGGKLVIPLVQPGAAGQQLAMLQGVEFIEFDFDQPHGAGKASPLSLGGSPRKQPSRTRRDAHCDRRCVALLVLLLNQGAPGMQTG